MTKTVNTCKALPTWKPIETTAIVMGEVIPEFETLEKQTLFFRQEAEKVEQAMHSTLPGGLYDQLFAVMCIRQASFFQVTREPEPEVSE